MTEVMGVVENIVSKKASNGDPYTIVDIQGHEQGFFDWDEYVRKAGIEVGDTVKIQHQGGKHPRIESVEKTKQKVVQASTAQNGSDSGASTKDRHIIRMSCMKSAVELLAQSDLDYESKEHGVAELAKRMEEWVLR